MNIFYLDKNPKKCAEYHNDKHVVKMILETAQLLCGAHWSTGSEAPYKLSHKNHPCAIWARTNIETYRWLCMLGVELSWEYRRRYLKTHKSYQVILWCIDNPPNLPDGKFFEPPLAMPDEYKEENHVQSYRNYYNFAKSSFSKWKTGNIPEWFILQ